MEDDITVRQVAPGKEKYDCADDDMRKPACLEFCAFRRFLEQAADEPSSERTEDAHDRCQATPSDLHLQHGASNESHDKSGNGSPNPLKEFHGISL
jgi:hypothetical protein